MDAGERLAGVTIGAGDVIFVHSGIERRERAQGAEDPEVRPGLAAEAISWLSERDIAVYSGDCFEALPSGDHVFISPLHIIGLGAMGLVILDNPGLTALLTTCAELRRSEFLLTCAPLPIAGATGSRSTQLPLSNWPQKANTHDQATNRPPLHRPATS
jgi:hypothetical protein